MSENKSSLNKKNKFQEKKQPEEFQWKRAGKTSFIWIGIIVCAIYLSSILTDSDKKEPEVDYTEYVEFLKSGQIEKATILIIQNDLTYYHFLYQALLCNYLY